MAKSNDSIDVALATAETITRRLPILWLGLLQPTPARTTEIVRMVTEKQLAFAEGVFKFQQQLFLEMFAGWSRILGGNFTTPNYERAAERVNAAATLPARQRVKANARRLRARKRV